LSKSTSVDCHLIEKRSGERVPRHCRSFEREDDVRALTVESATSRMPPWLWTTSILGILWNIVGLYQYAGTFTSAGRAAMTAGMTSDQAVLYLTLPSWISVVFAVGVFSGLAGSILLALRRRPARPVLAASFVGYGLLFAGDTYYGVFAAIPKQLAILAIVMLIAAALLWTSRLAAARGLLR
jgi:hypothetical protein